MSSEILIRVKPDGSGTLEQTILFSPRGIQAFGDVLNPATPTTPPKPLQRSDFAAPAERAGLELVSVDPLEQADGRVGGRAVFRFRDIRQVRLEQDLGMLAIAPGAIAGPVDVGFTRAARPRASILRLTLGEAPVRGLRRLRVPPNWHMLPKLADAFDGFRITLAVDVEGELVRTSSPYVDGTRVVVADYDMQALLADRTALRRIAEDVSPSAPPDQVRRALKTVPGMKFNDGAVVVEFR